jgi:hypothetical protein
MGLTTEDGYKLREAYRKIRESRRVSQEYKNGLKEVWEVLNDNERGTLTHVVTEGPLHTSEIPGYGLTCLSEIDLVVAVVVKGRDFYYAATPLGLEVLRAGKSQGK